MEVVCNGRAGAGETEEQTGDPRAAASSDDETRRIAEATEIKQSAKSGSVPSSTLHWLYCMLTTALGQQTDCR